MTKVLFVLSLFHATFSSLTFICMLALFIIYETEVMHIWSRYQAYPGDPRSVFNSVTFVGGWAIMATFAVWDFCALGAVWASRDQRSYTNETTRMEAPYSWCWCTTGEPNERLTDVCHGVCDGRIGRILSIAARIAIVSAMETISAMTLAAIVQDEKHQLETYYHVYVLSIAITALVFVESILTIIGCIYHSMLTFHWIKRYHRVEIITVDLSMGEDSVSSSTKFSTIESTPSEVDT